MQNTAAIIAENLLKINAVRLSPSAPFTWASGIQSPIYCDNRSTLSYPEIRNVIRDAFCALIREKFPKANAVAAVATAGIPHGALVADQLGWPLVYVRSKPKGHGLQNLIEGRILENANYIVVEDLVSTGGSSLKAIEALRAANANVEGLVSIFTYGFPKSVEAFAQNNLPYESLSNLEALLQKAVEINYIQAAELDTIREWQNSPETWAPAALKPQ